MKLAAFVLTTFCLLYGVSAFAADPSDTYDPNARVPLDPEVDLAGASVFAASQGRLRYRITQDGFSLANRILPEKIGLVIIGDNANVTNCEFRGNFRGDILVIQGADARIESCDFPWDSARVEIEGPRVVIVNCLFRNEEVALMPGSHDSVIGGVEENAGNYFYPARTYVWDSDNTLFANNWVGFDREGNAMSAAWMVTLRDSKGIVAERNVIAPGGDHGLELGRCEDCIVRYNWVGVLPDGATRIEENLDTGILVWESPGAVVGPGNLIASRTMGNGRSTGISIAGTAEPGRPMRVVGNRIGISEDLSTPIPDDPSLPQHRIYIHEAAHVVVGGPTVQDTNVISACLGDGILIADSREIQVLNNWIGYIPGDFELFGNQGDGVRISGALSTNNIIGQPGSGNYIFNNGGAGIFVTADSSGNSFSGNFILNNDGGGIVLEGGANSGLVAPAITSSRPTRGTAAPNARVEIFANDDQGSSYLGFVMADDTGSFEVDVPMIGHKGATLVATATDDSGNTSELSAPGEIPAVAHSADVDVSGDIELAEILRVLQFYNLGRYRCADPAHPTEDGYDTFRFGSLECGTHDADFIEADWRIDLSELLRQLQLFSFGEYSMCEDSEDGFCG